MLSARWRSRITRVTRLGIPRQVDRRLTGRVAAADDDHRLARERRGLRDGGVEDTRIGHLLERGHPEAAIGRAGREHDRRRVDVGLAGDLEPQPPSARCSPVTSRMIRKVAPNTHAC